jgi:geranylgeranyl pyrophosphate synthase
MAVASPLLQLPVLQADLVRVEDALRTSVITEDPFLTEVASHLILAGGKRVRPAFAVASAATADMVMGPATRCTTTMSWTTRRPAAPSRA